jgi:DNA-binding transcriptional LysR family regulator
MLNLNDLYLFVQVVDHAGFAATARALSVPKSTLSKRVAELEKHLGVRLIQRTSRSFVLTEVGRDVYRHASAMLIEAEAADSVVRNRLAEPSGTVRITASVPTSQFALADMLPDLALAYPKVHIVLHVSDRFVDPVHEGFDIAVRSHFAPLPDSSLVQRRIGFQPNHLVASPAYLERRGIPEHPADIAGHDGILADESARPAWSLQGRNGMTADVHPMPRFVADESLILLKAAIAGLGITCLPHSFCRSAIEACSLVRVLPDWEAGGVTTTLLMPHRRGQLPSVRAVADFLATGLSTRVGLDMVEPEKLS